MSLIVIIDDDADDLQILREAIEERGDRKTIVTYSCPVTAVESLKAPGQIPDYIFLDLNMPKLNGFECLKELRANRKLDQCLIIILSTSVAEDSRQALKDNGAAFIVKKPFRFSTYRKILDRVMAGKGM
jgi:CheY-like chemotaxis protein